MSVSDEAVEAAYDVSQHLLITTAEIELILTAAAPFIAAQAWEQGFKQGGPMHDVNMDDPDAHTRNPYRSGT